MISKLRPVDYAGAVVFLGLVGLVAFAALGGFQDGKADATFIGDSTAVGARVFIDDELAGVLRPKEVGGEVVPWLATRVVVGPHRLVAVSARGESLSMPYESHESGEAGITFSKAGFGR
jgi:hypothetical protein